MKIKVCDIQPNPFRHMDRYPINKLKVDALAQSIKQTDFWDNLVCRPTPNEKGKYQLAYGHHRLFALVQLGIEEIDIPVRNLSDAVMIQIMANENHDEWNMTPAILYETVQVSKEFLDGELAKYKSWQALQKSGLYLINLLGIKRESEYQSLRTRGVGQTTLLAFLGKNWKQHRIQEALSVIQDRAINREAVEAFGTTSEAQAFKRVVKEKKIPKSKQLEIAKKVVEIHKKRKASGKRTKPHGGLRTPSGVQQFRKDMQKAAPEHFPEVDTEMELMQSRIESWQSKMDAVRVSSNDLQLLLQQYNVEQIQGWANLLALGTVSEMIDALRNVLKKFGVKKLKLL